MQTYEAFQVSAAFVQAPAAQADYAKIVNETGVSLDYRVDGGPATALASGLSKIVKLTSSTDEVEVRRTDAVDEPVTVRVGWGLDTADAAAALEADVSCISAAWYLVNKQGA